MISGGFNDAPADNAGNFGLYNKRSSQAANCSRWAATVALRACRIFCAKHGKSNKGISKFEIQKIGGFK